MSIKSLTAIFSEALGLPKDKIDENLTYNSLPEWDSISHMGLIAAIDHEYSIMMDTHDIINLSSFKKAKEILAKYEVVGVC